MCDRKGRNVVASFAIAEELSAFVAYWYLQMERYTADTIERVSVVFGERDGDTGEPADDYEPTATIEIEHGSAVIDQIDVGPDGSQVLHEMTTTPEFEIDVRERPQP